jgi:hypothetical protein
MREEVVSGIELVEGGSLSLYFWIPSIASVFPDLFLA